VRGLSIGAVLASFACGPLEAQQDGVAVERRLAEAARIAVGDSLRDLQAGVAAGCAPHLVRTGKGAALDSAALRALVKEVPHATIHPDLAGFAQQLIQRERLQRGDADEADSVFVRLQ
jgi:D-glycero-D-manno-heptose 1,7-bisphosphate phosphatase